MVRRTLPWTLSAAVLLAAPPARAQVVCDITQISDAPAQTNVSLPYDSGPDLDAGRIAFMANFDLTGDNPDRSFEVFLFDGTSLEQITDATGEGMSSGNFASWQASLDGNLLAFVSRADLTGGNSDTNDELYLYDGTSITQITHSFGGGPWQPSLDGGSVAFQANYDFTGDNPDQNNEIFLWDGTSVQQITVAVTNDPFGGGSTNPSLHQGWIAFESIADLTGENPEGNTEVFLYDGSTITQITDSATGHSVQPSLYAGTLAFASSADLTGENPDGNFEIFYWDGSSTTQMTDSVGVYGSDQPSLQDGSIAFRSEADITGGNPEHSHDIFLHDGSTISQVTPAGHVAFASHPSLDGDAIAFETQGDLTGENPDGSSEVFLASCRSAPPPPPPGIWLTSPELPGFEVKVRINDTTTGEEEPDCIAETICVSGALAGRPEIFVKVIGPRPNGFLWSQLSRFTPSKVEVWLRQVSTDQVNFYELDAVGPASDDVSGLQDRSAFQP